MLVPLLIHLVWSAIDAMLAHVKTASDLIDGASMVTRLDDCDCAGRLHANGSMNHHLGYHAGGLVRLRPPTANTSILRGYL
ncbi:hypothetical protein EEB13_03505 [Rhodococcus sp. WS3]|nr:hypothetical protein EEB13_03505 [Rhodococcus sp. WS3]